MPFTNAEQLLVELINRARLDPEAEAARFGIDLNADLSPGTIAGGSRQVLAPNALLHEAAADHSQWMLDTNTFSHTGEDGSSPMTRVLAAGYDVTGWVGENISVRGSSVGVTLDTVIVDQHEDLFLSEGHRVNMLRGHYGEVGIGQEQGDYTFSNGTFDSSMLTEKFAENRESVFLTGVIHNDSDGDDFYSIGEGVAGASIAAQGASTASLSTGGYALALTQAAGIAVSIGVGGQTIQVVADLSDGNGKLDVVGGTALRASMDLELVAGVTEARLLGTEGLTLAGAGAAERLTGNSGANLISGNGGNDTIAGGRGDDTLEGGAGTDTLDHGGSAAFVNVSLLTGYSGGGAGSDAEGDMISGFENVVGSAHHDLISGDHGANLLQGVDGDDLLRGRGGADSLEGGTGNDTADYSESGAWVNVSLLTGFAGGGAGSHATGDMFDSIENLIGSAHADRLNGDNSDNLLEGGAGADTLNGNGGSDTAGYAGSDTGVNVSLATGYASGGHATGDVFIGIENLAGSAHADMLNGDHGANVLSGGGGDDLLRGRGGADALEGGAGSDTATYSDSAGWVNVSLASGFAGGGSGSHAIGDTFDSIENLTGSAHDDRLSGDGGSNVLEGGAGADTLDGNGGSDTASYAGSASGVTVSLLTGYTTGGDAAGDVLDSIENLRGSARADMLLGDHGANRLEGGAGDDLLRGRDGADALVGGAGSDTADYTESAGFVNVSLLTGFTGGGAGSHAIGDTFESIENLTGSAHGDRLNGSHGANRLEGAGGDDTLIGNGGADVFVFRAGFGADVVEDFHNGTDRLDFTGHTGVSALGDLTITDAGADAVVSDGAGGTITLLGAAGLIDGADFLF